jgi:hypothetical protein
MSLCDLVAASLLAAPKLREGGCEANALPTSRSIVNPGGMLENQPVAKPPEIE